MSKDPRVYLAQVLERADRIERYITDGQDAFFSDEKTQDAVIRNFEVIGEAVKRVPADYREAHPEIPWKLMAGFRDVLIHGYEGVDLARVWKVAAVDLPDARTAIARLLPPLEVLEEEVAEALDDLDDDQTGASG